MRNYQREKGKEKNSNKQFEIKILNKFVIMLYFILIKSINSNTIVQLTINGIGEQKILSNEFEKPQEIYVNGKIQNYTEYINLTKPENNIIMKWQYQLIDLNNMFSSLSNITKVDFSNGIISEINFGAICGIPSLKLLNLNNFSIISEEKNNIQNIFSGCSSLISLNINNFSIISEDNDNIIKNMFSGCSSLKLINLNNISITSKNKNDMQNMFTGCSSLISLNINNFSIISEDNDNKIPNMLSGCSSLISLNLNNFYIFSENDNYVGNMFSGSSSLKYLIFNNFTIKSRANNYLSGMFSNCTSLISLNFNKFTAISVTDNIIQDMFLGCSSLISLNLNNFYISCSSDNSIKNMFSGCFSLISLNLNNFSIFCEYNNMQNMFSDCSSLISLKFNHFYIDIRLDNNMENMFSGCSSLISLNFDLFSISIGENNNMKDMFKGCDPNLKFCSKDSNLIEQIQTELKNSINNCSDICFIPNHKIIKEKKKCIDYCINDDQYKYEFNNTCHEIPEGYNLNNNNTNQEIGNSDNIKDEIIKIIRGNIMALDYDNLKKQLSEMQNENIQYIFYKDNEMNIIVSTTENQNNNKNSNNNITTINLGECEIKLKKEYNISEEESLIVYKIDVLKDGLTIPQIEYEFYYPLNSSKLVKLDLSKCKGIKIELNIPIKIEKSNIDKYNSSSDYYKNLCYKSTTKYGTDISLPDRKKEYVDNKMYVCEEKCDFIRYNFDAQKAVCSCDIKNNICPMSSIYFNVSQLLNSILDIKTIINLNVIKCYNNLFNINGIKNNIGFYIISPMIILHLLSVILFYIIDKKNVFNKIKDIIFKNQYATKLNSNKENNNIIIIKNENESKKSPSAPNSKKKKIISHNNFKNIIQINSTINSNLILNNKNVNLITNNPQDNEKNNKIDLILKYNIYELNILSYDDALKFDKRTYIEYYFSLLKTKHILVNSFYPLDDYNSRIIKMFLFFFLFILFFTINALFFNDSTMNKIYVDKGSFNFIYQLPQIIYSTLISSILTIIIKFFALSEKNVLEIKHIENTNIEFLNEKVEKIMKIIYYKFIAFFVLSFIFLMFFWYYLSCFCAIYENTQIHLIKDTIISFGMDLIYPLFIYLIPGIFRVFSLRAKNKNKECMYKFSKILQFL